MERPLTRKELLARLIRQAEDPFCTTEELSDLRNIIFHSDSFSGMNHLYVVDLYLRKDFSLFSVGFEEALRQCRLALQEKNKRGYFYLYRLYREKGQGLEARNSLRLSCDFQDPLGLLAMGRELLSGELFPKDEGKALSYLERAVQAGRKEGYDDLFFYHLRRGNRKEAEDVVRRAKEEHHFLPGVVE